MAFVTAIILSVSLSICWVCLSIMCRGWITLLWADQEPNGRRIYSSDRCHSLYQLNNTKDLCNSGMDHFDQGCKVRRDRPN